MKRASYVLLVLTTLISAVSAYPVRLPKQPSAVRQARVIEFRKRNPIGIKAVTVGVRGFVDHVVIDDTKFIPKLGRIVMSPTCACFSAPTRTCSVSIRASPIG